jgi:hypothetical protein
MASVSSSGRDGDGRRLGGAATDQELAQQRLAEFRRDLYGGRGPGISEAEWRRATRERPTVAGVPPAVSREAVYLQTLRACGELGDLRIEKEWAQAQFPQLDADGPPVAVAGTREADVAGRGSSRAAPYPRWGRSRRPRTGDTGR